MLKTISQALCVLFVTASLALGQTATQSLPASSSQITAAQREYLAATPEQRVKLAERLGERGAAAMAEKKGYQPILTGEQKSVRQGFDQVYRAADGRVVVVEAKGGTSPLGRGYGAEQGTPNWAVKAAEHTLRNSRSSTAEQTAARTVLEAAERGKLNVEVYRTRHVLGEPTVAVQESAAAVTRTERQLAREALRNIKTATQPAAEGAAAATESTSAVANTAATTSRLAKVAKAAGAVGVAADAGFRGYEAYQVEQQYRAGRISAKDRTASHAGNTGGFVGGWGGAIAGAKAGALGGGAIGACAGGVGAPVGVAVGGVAGGVGGYLGGEYVGKAAGKHVAHVLQ
jgi:hypothetical protein